MKETLEINIEDYIKPTSLILIKNLSASDYLEKIGFVENQKGGYIFECNVFSRFILEAIDVVLLSNEDELALYNQSKGLYELNAGHKIAKIIKYFINYKEEIWNPYHEHRALLTIKRDVFSVAKDFNTGNYINLEDGILDLSSYRLKKHSPRYLSTIQLPFKYLCRMETPIFDRYLSDITCGDVEIQNVLQEITGYCLCNSTAAEKAFFFVGSGCNGKSVYAKILQKLSGDGNFSNTSLSAIGGNFGLAQLSSSNVNISAENNSAKVNSEVFKAIVSGDTVEVNRKYKDAISVKIHTKLVLLFNSLPDCDDLTYGYFRKILIIPFNQRIQKEDIDVNLIYKLEEELPGIFHWAIQGLKRLQKNNYKFSDCEASEIALNKYKETLNPIAEFFDSNFVIKKGASIKRSDIYKCYYNYCINNSIEVISCQKFWQLLKAYFADKNQDFELKKIKGYDYVKNITLKKTQERS